LAHRNVIYKGKRLNIKKVAALYKDKYICRYRNKNNKERKLKFIYDPINLPALKYTELSMVIVKGYGINPTMIITNLNPNSKKLTLTI